MSGVASDVAAAAARGESRVLVVRVGTERAAIPLASVREVVDAPSLVPVPMAPPALRGHCAVRGQHLPVLDLARLLRVPRATDHVPMLLVWATGDCALVVDDALDVWTDADAAARPLPAGGRAQDLVVGLLQRGDDLAMRVDADALSAAMVATLRGTSSR